MELICVRENNGKFSKPVDVNKAHLAWAETNRHGNIVARGTEQTPLQDRRSDQVKKMAQEKLFSYAKNFRSSLWSCYHSTCSRR